MNLFELLRLAFSSLLKNGLRSLLTILGIVIGVAAVIALVSFGQSYQNYVDSQFQGIGASTLTVNATNPNGPNSKLIKPQPLTIGDAQAIADPQNVPGVLAVAPAYNVNTTLVADKNSMTLSVTGSTDAYLSVRNLNIDQGRFISTYDVNNTTLVAVLGTAVVQKLFPGGVNPVGKPVHINSLIFSVIGTLKSSGGGQGNQDRQVIIPITTAQTRLGGTDARTAAGEYRVSNISVKTASSSMVNPVKASITTLLSARHHVQYVGEEDFNVFSQGAILTSLDSILSILTAFLGMIAGISLLVGGIGVMNIMLVTVSERTREIGLRKAVGAKYGDLLWQFLIESVTLCLSGGLIGVGLGIGLLALGGVFLPTLHVTISLPAIVLAVGVSSAIGVFFGLYPANRAAILSPIEALRYE